MRAAVETGYERLGADLARRVDAACDSFEGAWRAGQQPVIEGCLADVPETARLVLVRELILFDAASRRRGGAAPRPEDYQGRFPDLEETWLAKALAAPAEAPSPPACPAIPGYEVQEELGRGGMGAVFKGHDPHLGRAVAVKVLLDRHHGHPELHERFVEEARVAGQLQHPGVVPVYAMGEAGPGRPYFTMKLVEGRTLADLLRERAAPGEEWPRFLKVFEQVCQAVAYAHSRGVIHRDLKPANVMVGAFGEVQVMDWGLAGRVRTSGAAGDGSTAEEPPRTWWGRVLGTPGYMAPEQANGEVDRLDERCDVFGLGALLCEILTGRPPYVGGHAREAQRQAREGDLSEAWSRLDGCGAEADLVRLAKGCLSAQRDERPRDAGVVAGAVTAYLAGVQERLRAAELERAAAEARAEAEGKRRRLTAALGAAVLALAALSGGGAWWLSEKRDEAEREMSLAYREARDLHEVARAAGVADPLAWTKAVAAARHADGLLAGGWASAARHLEVAELRQQVEEENAAVERDRDLLVRLAEIRLRREDRFARGSTEGDYARAFRQYGLDVDRLPAAQAAEWIRARPPQAAAELTAALDDWAMERRRRHRPEADWRRLLDLAREADPDPWREALRAAVGGQGREAVLRLADAAEVERLPVQSVQLLALVLGNAGAGRRAEAVLRAALVRHPGDVWLNYALAEHLHGQKPPRLEEAIRFYTVARAQRPETGLQLGYALLAKGNHEEAVAVFRELARLRPANVHHQHAVGCALASQGKHDEAIAVFQAVLRRSPDLAVAHDSLGIALARRGRLDEAIASFREALLHRPGHVTAHFNLARAFQDKGQYQDAVASYQEALRRQPGDAGAHNNLGNTLGRLGRLDEAVQAYRHAIHYGPADAGFHDNLGNVFARLGRVDEAVAAYREALRHKPDYAVARLHLGLALQQQGQLALALASLKEGHGLGSENPSWPHPSARCVREVEQMLKVEPKLPAFLRGEARPADAERLALARICQDDKRRLYQMSARLYAEAFAAQPAPADDVQAGHRYHAALAAARAGCGHGEDAPPDATERVRWRQQALAWLRAELAAYAKLVEAGTPGDRTLVRTRSQTWRHGTALAGLRDGVALDRLPLPERDGWCRLWADVAALLVRASAPR